jgi:hypothetical protein
MTNAPSGSPSTRSARIRSELGHPVVDADGHWIETAPVMKEFFLDYVKSLGGGDLAARFEAAGGLDYDDTVLRPAVVDTARCQNPRPGDSAPAGAACRKAR